MDFTEFRFLPKYSKCCQASESDSHFGREIRKITRKSEKGDRKYFVEWFFSRLTYRPAKVFIIGTIVIFPLFGELAPTFNKRNVYQKDFIINFKYICTFSFLFQHCNNKKTKLISNLKAIRGDLWNEGETLSSLEPDSAKRSSHWSWESKPLRIDAGKLHRFNIIKGKPLTLPSEHHREAL